MACIIDLIANQISFFMYNCNWHNCADYVQTDWVVPQYNIDFINLIMYLDCVRVHACKTIILKHLNKMTSSAIQQIESIVQVLNA